MSTGKSPPRAATRRSVEDVLNLPPRPFAVRIPKAATKRQSKKYKTALIVPDTHVPYHDEKAVSVVIALAKEIKPDLLIHLGDLVDCYSISRYEKNPVRRDSLQSDLDGAKRILWRLAEAAPQARRILFAGNHEDRFRRAVWSLQGIHRELANLDKFQQALSWPSLLDLDGIGFEWVDYENQPATGLIPFNAVMHGYKIKPWSAMTAQAEHDAYHLSGLSGHSHRLGSYFKTDIKGSHNWVECGHLTQPLECERQHENHQQGCVVTTYREDDPWFRHELVFIEKGRTLWRDSEFRSA